MYINVDGTLKDLYYGIFTPCSGYGPDCTADLLNTGLMKLDDDNNPIMTEEEFRDAIEYLKDLVQEDIDTMEENGEDTESWYPVVTYDK